MIDSKHLSAIGHATAVVTLLSRADSLSIYGHPEAAQTCLDTARREVAQAARLLGLTVMEKGEEE